MAIDPKITNARRAAQQIADISVYIDESEANVERDREALGWHRVTKAAEEAGEVIDAWLRYTGGNPRKGPAPLDDVIAELLDTANAALAGVEHLTGNSGKALGLLFDKVDAVHERAGLQGE